MSGTPGERDGLAEVVARVLMAAWEQAEGKPVNASYVATFADMARAILASPLLAQARQEAAREALRDAADAVRSRFEFSLLDSQECQWVEAWLQDRAAGGTP